MIIATGIVTPFCCFLSIPADKLKNPDLVQWFLGTTRQEPYQAASLERQPTD
jgi:hypothetical protein